MIYNSIMNQADNNKLINENRKSKMRLAIIYSFNKIILRG
jgi:hypothetical protein